MVQHQVGRETTVALQVLLVKVGTRAPLDSDGNPHCVDLVLESQQAVSNALLVARKSHSNPFDVTVGEEEERVRDRTGRRGRGESRTLRGLCGPVTVRGIQLWRPEGSYSNMVCHPELRT